jgi:hypothetical protein
VSKSILGVSSSEDIVESGREHKEEASNGLLNARSKSLCHSMEFGGGTWRSATAIFGTTLATGFDSVLPIGMKNDGIRGREAGLAIHTQGVKLIKLGAFCSLPLGPSVKSAEFATSEVPKCTLGIVNGLGLQRADEEGNFIVGNVIGVDGMRGTKGMDDTEIGGCKCKGLIQSVRGKSGEQIGFLGDGVLFASCGEGLGSKSDLETRQGRSFLMKGAEFVSGIPESEDWNVLDGCHKGTNKLLTSGAW